MLQRWCANAARFNRFSSSGVVSPMLCVSEEVMQAIQEHRPVVALESTVITHGMPRPHNFHTAIHLQELVRQNNCTPATVGCIRGKICVGLSDQELEYLSVTDGLKKISRRDYSYAIANNLSGGTTVAGTVFAASLANIPVLATGGCGGVHRGAWDVSADLRELGASAVAVVCAGVKSILDIAKTLEYLETEGVPVVTFGDSDEFPNFFTRKSGHRSPFSENDYQRIARLIKIQFDLLNSGVLVAVPIPHEFEKDGHMIQAAIVKAVDEASAQSITGQNVSPFLLSRVNELTKGKSLDANIGLIKNNALVASRIACELNKLQIATQPTTSARPVPNDLSKNIPSVVVIGGTSLDTYCVAKEDIQINNGGTYAGDVIHSIGGVGCNHARGLAMLGLRTRFVSIVGDDFAGTKCLNEFEKLGICEGVRICSHLPTSNYVAMVMPDRSLSYGVLDNGILAEFTSDILDSEERFVASADFVIVDGNISVPMLKKVAQLCERYNRKMWFEPSDVRKTQKIAEADALGIMTHFSPNWNEFCALLKFCDIDVGVLSSANNVSVDKLVAALRQLWEIVDRNGCGKLQNMVISRGAEGGFLVEKKCREVNVERFNAPKLDNVEHPSGAGDCFNVAMIYGILTERKLQDCIELGIEGARIALQSRETMPDLISTLNI